MHYRRGVARIESKGRHKSGIMGSSGSRVRPALEERNLGGSGGMPAPPTNFLDFRPSEIVAGAIWGRNTRPYGRRTCCVMLRGVLTSYFRSGNFEVLYTPINNYTNGVVAGPADPRVDQLS